MLKRTFLILMLATRSMAADNPLVEEFSKVELQLLSNPGMPQEERQKLELHRSELHKQLFPARQELVEFEPSRTKAVMESSAQRCLLPWTAEIIKGPLNFFQHIFNLSLLSVSDLNKFEQMTGALTALYESVRVYESEYDQLLLSLIASYSASLPQLFMGFELVSLPMANLTGNARLASLRTHPTAQRQHHMLQFFYVINQHVVNAAHELLGATSSSQCQKVIKSYHFSHDFYVDALIAYFKKGSLLVDDSSLWWRVGMLPWWLWQRRASAGYLKQLLVGVTDQSSQVERHAHGAVIFTLSSPHLERYIDLVCQFEKQQYLVTEKAGKDFLASVGDAVKKLQLAGVFAPAMRSVMVAKLLYIKHQVQFFQQGLKNLAVNHEKRELYVKYRVSVDDPLFARLSCDERFVGYAERYLMVMDQYFNNQSTSLDQYYELYALSVALRRLVASLTPQGWIAWIAGRPECVVSLISDMQSCLEGVISAVAQHDKTGMFAEKGVLQKVMSGEWIKNIFGGNNQVILSNMVNNDALKTVMNERSNDTTKTVLKLLAWGAPVAAAYAIKKIVTSSSESKKPERAEIVKAADKLDQGSVDFAKVDAFLTAHPDTAELFDKECPEFVASLKEQVKKGAVVVDKG